MESCCSSSHSTENQPNKHRCPANGRTYSKVAPKTIRLHLKQPWKKELPDQGYYFCNDPHCDVVYFGQDNSVINQPEIRTAVGQKSTDENSTICYCFGVSQKMASEDSAIRAFIVEQTQSKRCACEARNPSGRCCLKDFSAH